MIVAKEKYRKPYFEIPDTAYSYTALCYWSTQT